MATRSQCQSTATVANRKQWPTFSDEPCSLNVLITVQERPKARENKNVHDRVGGGQILNGGEIGTIFQTTDLARLRQHSQQWGTVTVLSNLRFADCIGLFSYCLFTYLGSAPRVFNLFVLWSCASSIVTPFYSCPITSVHLWEQLRQNSSS